MGSITAANSVFTLSIESVYPTPVRLQGYSTDDAFTTEAVTSAEVVKGVDGRMSSGWLPTLKVMTITLQADSASILVVENWNAAQEIIREILKAQATILLPATGRKYTCSNGILSSYVPITGVQKTLQARPFSITWDDISPAVG